MEIQESTLARREFSDVDLTIHFDPHTAERFGMRDW
jgi:hypothetical protein